MVTWLTVSRGESVVDVPGCEQRMIKRDLLTARGMLSRMYLS